MAVLKLFSVRSWSGVVGPEGTPCWLGELGTTVSSPCLTWVTADAFHPGFSDPSSQISCCFALSLSPEVTAKRMMLQACEPGSLGMCPWSRTRYPCEMKTPSPGFQGGVFLLAGASPGPSTGSDT